MSELSESETIKLLQEQIQKMKCCQNCEHCHEIKSYKALGGKEIHKICSDGNYICDKWELKKQFADKNGKVN